MIFIGVFCLLHFVVGFYCGSHHTSPYKVSSIHPTTKYKLLQSENKNNIFSIVALTEAASLSVIKKQKKTQKTMSYSIRKQKR